MAFIKIRDGEKEIELTPEVIRFNMDTIKDQFAKMSLMEMTQTASALGISLPQIISLLRK